MPGDAEKDPTEKNQDDCTELMYKGHAGFKSDGIEFHVSFITYPASPHRMDEFL